MSRKLLLILTVFLTAGTFFLIRGGDFIRVEINGAALEVEIADTQEEKIKGLSGRENLDENSGLLFVYDEPGIYGIWMKDMKFPLDIIWFDENYGVADIVQDARPDSFPKTYEPRLPSLYILEVNAGFVEQNRIKTGDSFRFIRD